MSTGHHEDTLDTVDGFLRPGDDAARALPRRRAAGRARVVVPVPQRCEPDAGPGGAAPHRTAASWTTCVPACWTRSASRPPRGAARPAATSASAVCTPRRRPSPGSACCSCTTGCGKAPGCSRRAGWPPRPRPWLTPRTIPGTADWLLGYGHQMWRSRHDGFRADGAYGQFALVHPAPRPRRRRDRLHRRRPGHPRRRLGGAPAGPARRTARRGPCCRSTGSQRALESSRAAHRHHHGPAGGPRPMGVRPTSRRPSTRSSPRVEVRRADDGWLLVVDDGGPQQVVCGDGRWPDAVGAPFVATGGWTSPGVFEATVVAVQTPHSLHLRCADGSGHGPVARLPVARSLPGVATRTGGLETRD